MSEPTNPLLQLNTYQVKHVLAAFKTTSIAESTKLTKDSGKVGDTVGDGFIVVNELSDERFNIPTIVWDWTRGSKTTSMSGYIEIADRVGGQFIDWFRTNIIAGIGVSTQHMVFSLKTYFSGIDRIKDEFKVIQGNPLIFHVHEFEDMMNSTSSGTTIKMHFTGAYNSTGNRVNLKPYQMTLTHKDGNLNNTAPEIFGGGGGLEFRGTEDGAKVAPRLDRLNKSKPMRNLKDLFEAFENELNQQQFTHKRQVQEWLKNIRDDYTYKIDPPPNQERGGKLPIKFEIKLDGEYQSYEIDNRNLPFEQTEEDKTASGVTSVPLRAGANLIGIVSYLMKFARKVGTDATLSPPKTFKTNVSYIKESNQLKVVIKIKKITAPVNTVSVDTGPGESAVSGPLQFDFKGKSSDVDITYLKTSITTDNGVKTLESGPRTPVIGNREPVMGERIPKFSAGGTEFFKSEFSGLRAPIMSYLNGGLEDSAAAANADIMELVYNSQTTSHEIEIYGNPHLMFDLQRKPSEAAELGNPGDAILYKIPESYPMYLKIDIYLEPDAQIGLNPPSSQEIPYKYYYTNHYEITGITNLMLESSFYQIIKLAKRDDII
jgi:hypothetical protein